MDERLGKATLDLEANLEEFRRNVRTAKGDGDSLERTLDALASISQVAERELNRVRMGPGQAAESRTTAAGIISGVRGISDEARAAAEEIDRVKLTETQATESTIAGERIKRNINDIGDEADRTKRKLAEVKLAGGPTGRSGVGVGIIGSGYGRVGLLGAAVGLGALTAPTAGPAALSLLAAIPVVAGAGVGALGSLALAFDGVGKAIEGDKKAYDDLEPSQQQFVRTVRSLDGWLDGLKQKAAAAVFPGLERGLRSALDPGTLHEIDVAVEEFGHAVGQAGAEWGRYFGSREFQETFGPLMKEGARDVGLMSDATLRLFDAVGQLAVAGIPVTDWMLTAIDRGMRLADSWLRDKAATGELSGAMDTAKTDLQLVSHLIGAFMGAVFQLGAALHPVSQEAVKDLTDGLQWLSRTLRDNRAEIGDIVGGALHVFVAAIKLAVAIVSPFVGELVDVAHAVGGWKVAFAIVLSGVIAKSLAGVALSMAGVSAEAAAAMTWSARLGAVLEGLRKMGPILIAIGIDYFVKKYGVSNAIQAGLNPTTSLGGDIAKGQSITVNGKQYPIGTSEAWNALRAAGAKVPRMKDMSGADYVTAAQSIGGSSSISVSDIRKNVKDATDAVTNATQKALSIKPPTVAAPNVASPFGAMPDFTKNLGSAGAQPAGTDLLPARLSAALEHAKNMVAQTQGAVAERWLHIELADLEKARANLRGQLEGASGKQKTAIMHELRSIDRQIASVNRGITSNLHQQAQAVKSAFQSKISSARSAISSAMSTLKQTLDAQLQAQLQSYIDETLAPRYFQGVDPATGAPRQTPAEAKLAAMQAADTLKQLQDAVAQATTPEERAAAKHQLDEYNLSLEAATERQKANADYTAAVNRAQADYAEKQRQLNQQLDQVNKGLQNGTASLADLQKVTDAFGLSLVADGGITDDFATLQDAVRVLATVLINESLKLAGVGDSKDAAAAAAIAAKLSGGATASAALGKIVASVGGKAVPMAAGGIGRVTTPTLFYSAGHEDYAFSGEGASFRDLMSGGGPRGEVGVATVGNEIELGIYLGRLIQKANGRGVRFEIV